jgi:hypothetical protein
LDQQSAPARQRRPVLAAAVQAAALALQRPAAVRALAAEAAVRAARSSSRRV